MSLFEMAAGSRYIKLSFDAQELGVISAACASVSEKEHERMSGLTSARLEQAARQAKKATDSAMADRLVMLFRPGQEILIEREDLEPVLDCLKAYEDCIREERAVQLKQVRDKIERCL